MDDLSIKHGYYFVIDRNFKDKIFNLTIGKGYKNDETEEISIKEENGFINYYTNGIKTNIRDASLVNPYDEIIDNFIGHLVKQYTKNALVKRVNDKLVPFFGEI